MGRPCITSPRSAAGNETIAVSKLAATATILNFVVIGVRTNQITDPPAYATVAILQAPNSTNDTS